MAREISTLRRDARETRRALLDAVGALLTTRGKYFSLPEVAAESGISTSSTYRHFDSVEDACEQFLARIMNELLTLLADVRPTDRDADALRAMCDAWVAQIDVWGFAAVELRATEGLLARRRAGHQSVSGLFAVLESALEQTYGDELAAARDREDAALLWLTLFDERLVLDLRESGRTNRQTSAFLCNALRGAVEGQFDSGPIQLAKTDAN